MKGRDMLRIGSGFDAHRFIEGRPLVLGGTEIPYEKGLEGHSDADVLLHAVMDAVLGAAGLGDIGMHFPDSDDRYEGISSLKLLGQVAGMIRAEGFASADIDVTLICEEPKIGPYKEAVRKKIADAFGDIETRVNIKGTTTEGMGFTGRKEGIACQAVCLLMKPEDDISPPHGTAGEADAPGSHE